MTQRMHWVATISVLIILTRKACHSFTFARKLCTFPRPCTTFQSAMTQHEIVTSCRPFGGDVYRIADDDHGDQMLEGCPIFAVAPSLEESIGMIISDEEPTRLGLEALVPGSFVLRDAVSVQDCEAIISSCENDIKFAKSQDSKRVVHIMASNGAVDQLSRIVSKHINLDILFDLPSGTVTENREDDDIRYTITGINKHWRIHRYTRTLDAETVAPSLDVGVQATKLSDDGSGIIWNATLEGRNILSRFTVILFLNDDFTGGHENFFVPASEQEDQMTPLLASIKPKVGSILVYPQSTIDQETIAYAKHHWPLHASLHSSGGTRPKYVLRTDILVDTSRNLAAEDAGSPLFQYDALVRDTFLPRSPIVDQKMSSHLASLYNPHMGVENAGPLLYSLVRFAKPRRIVEIGAGYTSLWLLQALKDNDMEMERIFKLQKQGKCRLLDYPWSVEGYVSEYRRTQSSLLCIDNCLHQRETATGAAAVATNLGLADYFEFIQGDAYDMDFDIESIDLLWCDFGVGSRMRDFARCAWRSIRPGGFLVCHSTLTNKGTRDWLEDVRARREESLTGIPPDEVVELSLLEPTKRYQNSVTILQRRKSQSGEIYKEPLYSLYA